MVIAQPDQLEIHHLDASALPSSEPPSLRRLQLLYEVTQSLAGAASMRTGLQTILGKIAEFDGWDLGLIWLASPAGLKLHESWHVPELDAHAFIQNCLTHQHKSIPNALAAWAARERHLVFVPSIQPETPYELNHSALTTGLNSALALPLVAEGQLYGVLELFSGMQRHYLPDSPGLFNALSTHLAMFIKARQLEQQLHDNSARLSEAHRLARMAYWEMNLLTLQLHGNEATREVLGLSEGQKLRDLHDLYAVVPPEDHPLLQAMIAGTQYPEYPVVNIEHRVRNAHGHDRHILVQAQGRFDMNGKPNRITGTIQDITDQKLATERALQSEHRWEVAFRNSPVPGMITEFDSGVCLDANDEMLRLIGKPRDQVVGQTTAQLNLYPPGLSRDSLIARVKEQGRVRDFELTTVLNGKEAHLLMNLEIIEFLDKTCLLGQWTNVTPQKQLEERLRLAAAALEHAGDALVLMNQKGNIISINPAFTQITGFTEHQSLGQWFFGLLLKPSGRHDKHFFRQAVAAVDTEGTWKGEAWGRRVDGEVIPTMLTLSAIRHPIHNKVTHYVAVFSDISRQKEYETRLQQMAWHDELTGVANRSLLVERGNRALLHAERHFITVALLFVDLNRFKAVNDTFGHAVGDELLRQVAERLCLCVRASDTVARIGGDEFVILLPEVTEENGAEIVVNKINRVLADPFIIDGHAISIGASIGTAHFPQDGHDIPELLQSADEALYRSKRSSTGVQ